jgi:CRISPR-associated exonuclease Cas4
MSWLLVVALILGGLALWLFIRSGIARRDTGLPEGRVTYVDTGAWSRCDRPLFSQRYALTGRPDYLVRLHGDLIPVEVKSGMSPRRPYRAHILQLAAYCLLVEEQEGRAPPFGILKYSDRAFEIDYSPALRVKLLETLDAIRRGLRAPNVDRSHDEAARCRGCGYRDQCEQRLA